MKGETTAEGDMIVGTDHTEVDQVAGTTKVDAHTVMAEAHTTPRDTINLLEATADHTDSYDRYERRDTRDRRNISRDRRDYSIDRRDRSRGRHEGSQSRGRSENMSDKGKEVQCYKCGKHGHIAMYCKGF